MASRIKRHLEAAEELQVQDFEAYLWILAQADYGAEALARRDPDAYVALFLAAAEECGYGPDTPRIANELVVAMDGHA